MKSYTTTRLLLTPTNESDSKMMLELLNSPKFRLHVGDRGVRTLEQAQKYINEKIQPQHEKHGFGNYTLSRRDSGEKIGICGLYLRPGLEVPDIGFALFESAEGQGYAYEAASSLLRNLKQDYGIEKVSAITSHDNKASQALIEKLGLKFQKTVFLPGDPEELRYYEN